MSRIPGVFRSCIRCIVSSVSLTLRLGTFVCVGDVFYAFWMLCGAFVFSFVGLSVCEFVCVLCCLFGSFTVSRVSTVYGLDLF